MRKGRPVDTEAIIGLGSAGLALAGAVASGLFSGRTNRQAHDLERQRRIETEVEAAERILEQYRDPLLDAAQNLQSRLYNIVDQDYFARYLNCGDPAEEKYAREYTLFAIAEYLCWAEIVRRELRFLDLGDVPRNRQLLAHLSQIQLTIQTDRVASPFKVFRGRQRAIAELTMVPTGAGEGPRTECIGYAAFSRRLHSDEEFAEWFGQLYSDVDVVAQSDRAGNVRLVRLQRDLIDMIDFLDPTAVRIIASHRKRMTSDPAVEAMPSAMEAPTPVPAQHGRRARKNA
jgi:hypothetical protein